MRAKATVVRELAWLKRVYNVAIRDEKVDKNPVVKVQFPKPNNARIGYLTDAEEASLKAVMDPVDWEATGLRRSEQFNLRWDDIDWRKGILIVNLSKNGQRRYLPLNDRVWELLKIRHKRNKSPFVFPSETGDTPVDGHNFVVRVFVPAMRLAGVAGFTWHCLRHTYASRLVMAGVDLRTTQELMGHLTIQMTLRYSHLAPSHLKDAVNRLLRR